MIFDNMIRDIVKEEIEKYLNNIKFVIDPYLKESIIKTIERSL